MISPQAVEVERNVTLREMQEVNDQPEEVVLDYLHATAHQGSSLGCTILGPAENLATAYTPFHTSYSDTGLWGCYGVVLENKVDDFVLVFQDEWMALSGSVSESEVEHAKNLLKASMLCQNNGTIAVCDEIGR